MNVLLNIFFITLLFVFQTTILHSFTILGVRPDTVLILSFFIGVKLGGDRGVTSAFTLGLIQDCLSSNFLGTNALSKGVVGFIFGNLRDKIIFNHYFSRVIFVLLAAFIDAAIILLISFLTISNKAQVAIMFGKLLLSSVYSALTGPLFIKIFAFFGHKASALLKKKDGGLRIRSQLSVN